MPALATLIIAFVGIGGKDASKVDRQVHALLDLNGAVGNVELSKDDRHVLANHKDGCKNIVKRLHANGVIAGELIDEGGTSLRLVVYNGDGGLLDFIELPLDTHALAKGDIESLRETVLPDLDRLGPKKAPHVSAPSHDDDGDDAEPEIEVDDPEPARPASTHKAAPAPVAKKVQAKAQDADADNADADAPDAKADDRTASADDDVDADLDAELAAQAKVIGSDGSTYQPPPTLSMRMGAGFGIIGRTFGGPATIAAYGSQPVPSALVTAELVPHRRVVLDVTGEHTVSMNSVVHGMTAHTEIEHWEATGALCAPMGRFDLQAVLGFGRRTFRIDSSDPGRSPDGDYAYGVLGGRISAKLGKRVQVRGAAAFEPVVAGADPTMDTLGPARRWALEVGADVVVDATSHVYVAGGAAYQRFVWSWDAGARGASGAVDQYPSATMSVGAHY